MDQGDALDFQALRAKFQAEELFLKRPAVKPALPEKPREVPPPQSPTHFLPVGARPSLLTSIGQSLEGSSGPRGVFKEDRKESKKPLIQIKGKDQARGGKEKPDEGPMQQKNGAELVPAVPPPPPTAPKKRALLGFMKKKRNSTELLAESILDAPPSDGPGPAPLMPHPPISAPAIPSPLLPAPVIPSPLLPPPAIPPPLLPAPVIPSPLLPAPAIPPPLLPAPVIPSPLLPPPAIPPPLLPAPVIPSPLLPAPAIPPPFLPALDIPPPLSPPPLLPPLDIPPPLSPPPLLPGPDIPPPLILAPPEAPEGLLAPPPGLPAPDAAVGGIPASLDSPPTPECDATSEMECPPLSISTPASQYDVVSPAPTPPPDASPSHPPGRFVFASPPPPQVDELPAVDGSLEVENMAEVEAPPSPPAPPTPASAAASTGPASPPPSLKAERPTSALAVLSRAEDLSPGRKHPVCDSMIFNLLEKAGRKTRPLTNPPSSFPSPEGLPPSPTRSLPVLPPVDYEGNAPPPKPVGGFNPRQLPRVMERIPEEGAAPNPELLPPLALFKRVLPDSEFLDPLSEKPSRLQLSPPPHPTRCALGGHTVLAPSQFSETEHGASDARSHSDWGGGHTGLQISNGPSLPTFRTNGTRVEAFTDPENPDPKSSPQLAELEDQVVYESTENVYEPMPASRSQVDGRGDGGKKRKGTPKNPYAEAQLETSRPKSKTGRFGKTEKKAAAEGSDEKEQKKKEKQRLEKEKKELKEKEEREKKERKEREKKENEMKKKFKITGQEDAMYQATVTVTNKGRKNDLPVTCGDVVSIIRTTNCPKGKWLARSSSHNFGYIAVDYVELDIKEMVELGKKATISHMSGGTNNSVMEDEVTKSGSRASEYYLTSAEAFSDDSEEWTGDEEEPLFPALEPEAPLSPTGHTRTLSLPDVGNKGLGVSHAHSCSDLIADGPEVQARHEALHKLATFFHSAKPERAAASGTEPEQSPLKVKEEAVALPEVSRTQEVDLFVTDMIILPPPDLYADWSAE